MVEDEAVVKARQQLGELAADIASLRARLRSSAMTQADYLMALEGFKFQIEVLKQSVPFD